MIKRILIGCCAVLFLCQLCLAQTTDSIPKKLFKPNPQKAVLLGAVLPGAGQVYNRKYWKVPFVYAGFGALVYAISWNGGYYNKYKTAYKSIVDEDPNTNEYMNFLPSGQDPATLDMAWLTEVYNQKQMGYRNNRDLAIMSIVGFYGLTLIDAYVDAQLYDFDISPNLSMHVEPVINYSLVNSSPNIGMKCLLTF